MAPSILAEHLPSVRKSIPIALIRPRLAWVVSWESNINSLGGRAFPLFPKFNEPENFVVLVFLADVGVGLAEQPGLGVAGEEGENALLPAAPLRDIMLLNGGFRILSVRRDGVEI